MGLPRRERPKRPARGLPPIDYSRLSDALKLQCRVSESNGNRSGTASQGDEPPAISPPADDMEVGEESQPLAGDNKAEREGGHSEQEGDSLEEAVRNVVEVSGEEAPEPPLTLEEEKTAKRRDLACKHLRFPERYVRPPGSLRDSYIYEDHMIPIDEPYDAWNVALSKRGDKQLNQDWEGDGLEGIEEADEKERCDLVEYIQRSLIRKHDLEERNKEALKKETRSVALFADKIIENSATPPTGDPAKSLGGRSLPLVKRRNRRAESTAEEREKHQKAFATRTMISTETGTPKSLHRNIGDSDDDDDPDWLMHHMIHQIDDFTDVTEEEKECMLLWNFHVMKYKLHGDCNFELTVRHYLRENAAVIVARNLQESFQEQAISWVRFFPEMSGAFLPGCMALIHSLTRKNLFWAAKSKFFVEASWKDLKKTLGDPVEEVSKKTQEKAPEKS